MKNKWFAVFLLLCSFFKAQSDPIDSNTVKRLLDNSVDKVVKAIEKSTAIQKDTASKQPLQPPAVALNKPMANLLTLLPVIFYVITLLVVSGKLKKEGAKLSWFLLDKELVAQLGKQTAQVETARLQAIAKAPTGEIASLVARSTAPVLLEQTADGDTPVPSDDSNKESVSRLIALLTGFITLGIASCLTSFYIYKSFTGHPDIDLGKLVTVLYGLGLGLVPYGFTKVAGALKSAT